MKKKINEVYTTTDFGIFKTILGNREDIERRRRKIEESVAAIGYVPAPIIVNEKMEVIDGQARLEFCKTTGTPIAYVVIEGLTIDDCIEMNKSGTAWGIRDYIQSYAKRGFHSYVITEKFINESPYSLNPTMWALTGTEIGNNGKKIKAGELDVDESQYDRGKDILAYWANFDDIVTNRRAEFLEAIGYCYLMPCVENDVLIRKIHQLPRAFQTIATVTDAIDVIEDAYNVRTRNHVYIETEYFKYLDRLNKGTSAAIAAKRNRR